MRSGEDDLIEIRTQHGDPAEETARCKLEDYLRRYPTLKRWSLVDVVIDSGVKISHSHPVLTLVPHTNEWRLVADFVHEQIHWFEAQNGQATTWAISILEAMFPDAPVSYPVGAGDSTHLHLIVCLLELLALEAIHQEMVEEFVNSYEHYTWIYQSVLQHRDTIEAVLRFCYPQLVD